MSDPPTEALTSACRSAIGDSLRSVVHFTDEGYERVYLREDLDAAADLECFVENERTGFERRDTSRGSELGAYEYTIHGYENGALTRVVGDDAGVFVTTDPLSASRFEEVAVAVRDVLNGRA
ncbi:hypotheical protein [Halarchaeum acidiphilum MH1-52-1]|uniref:Hypotheical protein n=1 Tax=Halarchaeum acidiphilum MH1-52-1 TaxID=1261545 RepID=U3A346_9EURY|nr:hypothetical protein [Halarchaeum acidiphilum]GAD52074.1 hypotheical protein [Halarchaeum acidiphilum MH1-52-1]